ncbi:MAG: FHA domain-containing protein [Acidobacteria bacterium]|nr:FHA domain-containing protein [Acidobacteriota bacterium]
MSSEQEQIAYLDFLDEDNLPCRVEITKSSFSIGRAYENELRIEDSRISRRHAEIIKIWGGKYVFRDKDSKCGSFVNGLRVQEHILSTGDEIVLGGLNATKLTFGYGQPKVQLVTMMDTQATSSHPPTNIDPELRGATVITDQQTRFLNTALMQKPEYVTGTTLQRLASLYEITHKILPAQSVNELAETWLSELFKALPIDQGAILLHNSTTNQLDVALAESRGKKEVSQNIVSNTIVEHTFREKVAILTHDATSDERFASNVSVILENIRSVLSAPISSKLRVWGVIYLDSRTRAALFTSEDLEFLMATAREAGLVIENLKLIEELRATQEQLIKAERLATIGKLTSAISHEIRNRLALLTGIEFIEMKYSDDPEVKQFTNMVLEGQRRALALVEEIRAFARNRTEHYEKTRKPIVPAIKKTLSIIQLDTAVAKRIVNFNYDTEPELVFNEEKLEQVIINLVRNAVEATEEYTGEININLAVVEKNVVIQVSDNGQGIAQEIMGAIWEPFFSTKGEEGTGIGLEICRRIIEAHNGHISCSSQMGVGTCFTINLPLENYV